MISGIDERCRSQLFDLLADYHQVLRAAHEGDRHRIHAQLQAKLQVRFIFVRSAPGSPGRAQGRLTPLCGLSVPPGHHLRLDHGRLETSTTTQLQVAVVQQDAPAGLHASGSPGKSTLTSSAVSHHLAGCQGQLLPGLHLHLPVLDLTGADFRSLQILQDGDRPSQAAWRCARSRLNTI